MSNILDLQVGENSLIAAYEAVKTGRSVLSTEDLVKTYNAYFSPAVPAHGSGALFDRFALVNPAIKTVVRSTTTR